MTFTVENFREQPSERLREKWGWVALRGFSALIFGVLALSLPGVTLTLLVAVWGVYALMDGVLALAAGLRMHEGGKPVWSLILVGLMGLAAGLTAFFWPGLTALTLMLIIGSWAIAIGLLQVVATMRLRKHIQGEWLHALSGLLSLVFGLAIVLWPGAGAIALAWLIGWFSILFGAILVTMAFSLRIVSRS